MPFGEPTDKKKTNNKLQKSNFFHGMQKTKTICSHLMNQTDQKQKKIYENADQIKVIIQ